MPTLTVTKTYDDGQVLNESDLDSIKSSIETFINSTKLDGDNIQISAIADDVGDAMTATGANAIADVMTATGADAIAAVMSATGADAIAATMTATGADAIAADISATGADAILADVATFPVTQANLAAAARTRAVSTDGTDPGAGGVVRSAEITSFDIDNTAFEDVTGAAVTLTTSGRPVVIQCISSATHATPSTSGSHIIPNTPGDAGYYAYFAFLQDGAIVSKIRIGDDLGVDESSTPFYPVTSLQTMVFPAAGTYTFKLQAAYSTNSWTITKFYLVAYEL